MATDGDGDRPPVTIRDLLALLSIKMGFDKPFQIEDMCVPQLINSLYRRCEGTGRVLLFHDGAEFSDTYIEKCLSDVSLKDLAFVNMMIRWEGDEEVGETCHFRVIEIIDYMNKAEAVEAGVRILTVDGDGGYDPEWSGTWLFDCGYGGDMCGVVGKLLDIAYTRAQIRRLVPLVGVNRDTICELIGVEMPFYRSISKMTDGKTLESISSTHQKYIDLVLKYLIESKGGDIDIEPLELIAFDKQINSKPSCSCGSCDSCGSCGVSS